VSPPDRPAQLDVLGVGYAGLDHLTLVPEFPAPGEKVRMQQYVRQGGGQTATALVTLARLGRRVAAVCAVGDDDEGRAVLEELRAEGVEPSAAVVRAGVETQCAWILVDARDGERTVVCRRDAALDLGPGDVAALEPLDRARALILDLHEELGLEAARRARVRGIPVILDAERVRPFAEELLSLCDVVICGGTFLGEFSGESELDAQLRAVAACGPGVVAATHGADGVTALVDGARVHRPAVPVDAVDTTGAGDVFHGAFTHALLEGRAAVECLDFAAGVAARSCAQLGRLRGGPIGLR
jgi:sulfofructose kinase